MSKSAAERIKEMQEKGTITPEQAAELLSALEEEPAGPQARRRRGGSFFDMGWVDDMVDGITSGLGVSDGTEEAGGKQPRYRYDYRYEWRGGRRHRGAAQRVSQFEHPIGDDFEFKDNRVVFSRVAGIRLVRAKMKDNSFSAASLQGAQITDGEMEGCFFAGAAANDLRIDGGRMKGVFLKGSKVNRLAVGKGCLVKDTRFAGTGITDFTIQGESSLEDTSISGGALNTVSLDKKSRIRDCKLSGVGITRLMLESTELVDTRIKATIASDIRITDSEVRQSDLRATRFQDVEILSSRIRDCRFDAIGFHRLRVQGSTLQKVAFRDTADQLPRMAECLSIVDSSLENIEFISCRFNNTTIKGISAEGLRLRGVDLSGRTIEKVEDLRSLAER